MTDNTQAAGKTDAPSPEKGTEGNAGRVKGVDDYIKEFDADTSPKSEKHHQTDSDDDKPVTLTKRQLRETELRAAEIAEARREARDRLNKDISEAVTVLKGDSLKHISDDVAEAWFERRVAGDSRLKKAFMRRDENRSAWSGIVKALAEEFVTKFGNPEETKTQRNREAVRAAAQKKTHSAPTDKDQDYSKMSDNALLGLLPKKRVA